MPLDKIVVIILAIMFFGGLAYVIWKGRRQDKAGGVNSPATVPGALQDGEENKPREKGRRGSRKQPSA